MSTYCLPQSNKVFNNYSVKSNLLNEITIIYNLDKMVLEKIMRGILTEFCYATVSGYNKMLDKYWCKKYSDSMCELSVEIELVSTNYSHNYTEIKITYLLGKPDERELFLLNFKETLEMYKSSKFIRYVLWGS